MKATYEWFKQYVRQSRPKRHVYYKESVEKAKRIRVHSNGDVPGKLITERRPSESERIKKYREEIFVPITKSTFSKVMSSLMKIRKSSDWGVKFNESPKRILENERPESYLMADFPNYSSITNWYFQIGLRNQLVNSNAKVFVMPLDFDIPDNEYLKPYPFIFEEEYVLDYEKDSYYVLKSPEKITFQKSGDYYEGDRYYVVTSTHIQAFDQIDVQNTFTEAFEFEHNLGFIPVYGFKATVVEETRNQVLNESKISGMIPYLDEVVREYSDQQAEVVQHVHSTLWAIQPNDCKKCSGTGKLIKKNKNTSVESECDMCGGKGIYPFNSYENLIIPKMNVGESQLPTPPAGYITKDSSIVKIQMERIEIHLNKALGVINMEFLSTTPLNQSGLAKEVDKEELNNFVHGIAEDGVELLDNICRCTVYYRYGNIITSGEELAELAPVINVPEKFDLIGDRYLIDDIERMKLAKVDSAIINAAEVEYAAKRFNTDPKVRDKVSLKLSLDPFAGQSEDVVNARSAFDLIKKEDAIIHANIHSFIDRALDENEMFITLPKREQLEILRIYAAELLTEPIEPDETETNETIT